jgi:hypothetical protein
MSDHDRVVGHLGVTYFGVSQLPIGVAGGNPSPIVAPVIGIRYWLKPNLGLDLGLGFGLNNSSITTTGTTTNGPSEFGLLLHGGLPLALASGQHYAFEIIPEVNLGFASGSWSPPGGSVSMSGFRLDLGARVGGEIHFGFMGVPQLSLVASVGLYLHDQSTSVTPSGGSSSGQSSLSVATSVQSDPWSIFADNIAAIYYF